MAGRLPLPLNCLITMEKKVKLIWDFKGGDARQTAEHYDHHLREFCEKWNVESELIGVEHTDGMHSVAYMVVSESDVITVRDSLRPNRGEWYNP